jgi:hypothetical protein
MTLRLDGSAPRSIVSYDLCSDGKVFGSISYSPAVEGALLAEFLGRLLVLKRRGYFRQTVVLETVAEKEIARLSMDLRGRRGSLQTVEGRKFTFRLSGRMDWSSAHGDFRGRAEVIPGENDVAGEIRQDHPDRPISPYSLSLWGLMQLGLNLPAGNSPPDSSARFSSVSSRLRDISSSSSWLASETLIP